MRLEQDYVQFFSPGSFFSETTTKEIDGWNISEALHMAKDIVERHGARPHSFRFITRGRAEHELDAKRTAASPLYFLPGGTVLTLADVKNRNDPSDRILISNMECNGYDRVIETSVGGYRSVLPVRAEDVIL